MPMGYRSAQPPANRWKPSGLIVGIHPSEFPTYFSDADKSEAQRPKSP